MNRIIIRISIIPILGCGLISTAGVSATAAGTSRANLLFILPDQWRAQAFGFSGDPNVKTPHLDRLARQSVNFFNAIAGMPVCCPTRASLLTGQRPLTTGVFLNDVPLNSNAVTLAKVLRTAGYDTAYIGKWHLNGDGRSRFVPPERRQGFDYWKAQECTHEYNNSHYYANADEKLLWQGYDAIAQTRDAQEYLRTHSKSAKPFFLFLAWGPPHEPYDTAPEKQRGLYSPDLLKVPANVPDSSLEKTKKLLAGYYAHCSALDECVGALRVTLQEAGLEDNTLLVFTSDHGDLLGAHGARNKQQPYDESIQVPMLFHWPAELSSKPRRLEALINSEDVMPTILGLLGISIPSTVEGLDYSGYIHGRADPSDGAALMSCVAPFGQWTRRQGGREYRGIRTRRYTYVCDLNGPWLLFDDQKDPGQLNNLVGLRTHAALQQRLDATLQRKLVATHDLFLPAQDYIREWGYQTDNDGTVPYDP